MNPTIISFPHYTETVYSRIAILNRNLSNVEKWAITSDAMYSIDVDPYNPAKTYTIQLSTYRLGQLYELRQILPLFYRRHYADGEFTNQINFALSSVGMIDLFHDYFEEGYTYKYYDPNMPAGPPECQCHMIDYREDEEVPVCGECHQYVQYKNMKSKMPKTDEETNEHFYLIPYPQRRHMVITKTLWVLAFMLEGYGYKFVECDPQHIPQSRSDTHDYFRFYAKYVRPNKTELRNYQISRRLLDERFDEPVQPSISSSIFSFRMDVPVLERGKTVYESDEDDEDDETFPFDDETDTTNSQLAHSTRYSRPKWWETPNYWKKNT